MAADRIHGGWWAFPLLLALFFSSACQRQGRTVLGQAPAGQVRSILAVRAGDTPATVTLKGLIVEKCPVAGCWFYLRDETGTIKVDTKAAGFVVVDVPLHTCVTVRGRVLNQSEETSIEAAGLRY